MRVDESVGWQEFKEAVLNSEAYQGRAQRGEIGCETVTKITSCDRRKFLRLDEAGQSQSRDILRSRLEN